MSSTTLPILTEVTLSTSSRQEAMEGEPVRRHVSDAVLKYDKPVYGMFIAVRIDTNTAETVQTRRLVCEGRCEAAT